MIGIKIPKGETEAPIDKLLVQTGLAGDRRAAQRLVKRGAVALYTPEALMTDEGDVVTDPAQVVKVYVGLRIRAGAGWRRLIGP